MQLPIAPYIDHTLLKATSTFQEIQRLCEEALRYQFAAVCVPPFAVSWVLRVLAGTGVRIATVIGFPLGYSTLESKLAETRQALKDGADELDVVIHLMALKNGDWNLLETEMIQLTGLIKAESKTIKVIIESGVLNDQEIISCCDLYGRLGVDFLKTSTGFSERGASVQAVRLMRACLPERVKIKASGGIRTLDFARQLLDAGATRLGCSASVSIMQEWNAETKSSEATHVFPQENLYKTPRARQ